MRIRSIKPEFWRSSDVTSLAIEDRLLFVGLWSYVDDNGVGVDKLSAIAADLFADDVERDPEETFARVSRGLARLAAAERILRYVVEKRQYLMICGWGHQKIDHPSQPRHPLPDGRLARADSYEYEALARLSRALAPVTGEQGNRGAEEQGAEEQRKREVATSATSSNARGHRLPDSWRPDQPVIDTIKTECPTVDLMAEHRKFTDYWKSQAGQRGVKADWNAVWRNWMRRAAENPSTSAQLPRNVRERQALLNKWDEMYPDEVTA